MPAPPGAVCVLGAPPGPSTCLSHGTARRSEHQQVAAGAWEERARGRGLTAGGAHGDAAGGCVPQALARGTWTAVSIGAHGPAPDTAEPARLLSNWGRPAGCGAEGKRERKGSP